MFKCNTSWGGRQVLSNANLACEIKFKLKYTQVEDDVLMLQHSFLHFIMLIFQLHRNNVQWIVV